jgi:hypothetical protein
MYLTHEMSLGIGLSTVTLAALIRIIFYPLYKRNVLFSIDFSLKMFKSQDYFFLI